MKERQVSTVFPSAAPLLVSSAHVSKEVLSCPEAKDGSARKAGSSLWFRQQPDNCRTYSW